MDQAQKHPRNDPRAISALNAAIDHALAELKVIHRRWPDVGTGQDHISSLYAHLNKAEPWRSSLRWLDLFDILGSFIKRYEVTQPEGATEAIKLSSGLTAERFRAFSKELSEYLLSFPRSYDFFVELPSMPNWGTGEIRLTDRLWLAEEQSAATAPTQGLFGLAQLAPPPRARVLARIRGFGFAAGRLDTTAVGDAISYLKQFCYLFQQLRVHKSSFSLSSAVDTNRLTSWVADCASPEEKIDVGLPEKLKDYLSRFSVDETVLKVWDRPMAAKTVLAGAQRTASTRKEKTSALVDEAAWAVKLMDCPSVWRDGVLIRAAAEWGFDSEQADNETLSLLQACVGLEAILGDDNTEEPLTSRLADRCAYLLGKSHKDREVIRRDFTALYKVRSKLVHGRIPKLGLSDSRQLHFARTTLREVIICEAKMLHSALNRDRQKNVRG